MPGETIIVSPFDEASIADCIKIYWDGTKRVFCPIKEIGSNKKSRIFFIISKLNKLSSVFVVIQFAKIIN